MDASHPDDTGERVSNLCGHGPINHSHDENCIRKDFTGSDTLKRIRMEVHTFNTAKHL